MSAGKGGVQLSAPHHRTARQIKQNMPPRPPGFEWERDGQTGWNLMQDGKRVGHLPGAEWEEIKESGDLASAAVRAMAGGKVNAGDQAFEPPVEVKSPMPPVEPEPIPPAEIPVEPDAPNPVEPVPPTDKTPKLRLVNPAPRAPKMKRGTGSTKANVEPDAHRAKSQQSNRLRPLPIPGHKWKPSGLTGWELYTRMAAISANGKRSSASKYIAYYSQDAVRRRNEREATTNARRA